MHAKIYKFTVNFQIKILMPIDSKRLAFLSIWRSGISRRKISQLQFPSLSKIPGKTNNHLILIKIPYANFFPLFLLSHRYANKAKNLADFAKDTQFSPIDTAIWWTEFILRSSPENLALLTPLGKSIFWFQRRDLDVWLFFGVIGLIWVKVGNAILMFLYRKVCTRKAATNSRISKKDKSS